MNILERIIEEKKPEIEELRGSMPLDQLIERAKGAPAPRGFEQALRSGRGISVIAEIKKASPSKGLIRQDFDPPTIAQAYEKGGAAALSVLTELNYFQGKREYLGLVKETVKIPVLRKDFIVDPHQVPESRILGADALLLIVACLEDSLFRDLLSLAGFVGLDALVEVHTAAELERALAAEAKLIGINNRNLETFEVDLQTTFDLVQRIPAGKTIVSESGISSRLDIDLLRDAGVDAVLVGESLMRQKDLRAAVRKLVG